MQYMHHYCVNRKSDHRAWASLSSVKRKVLRSEVVVSHVMIPSVSISEMECHTSADEQINHLWTISLTRNDPNRKHRSWTFYLAILCFSPKFLSAWMTEYFSTRLRRLASCSMPFNRSSSMIRTANIVSSSSIPISSSIEWTLSPWTSIASFRNVLNMLHVVFESGWQVGHIWDCNSMIE